MHKYFKELIVFQGAFHPRTKILGGQLPQCSLLRKQATITFQNLNEFMNEFYFDSKGCNIPHRVEKWIRWFLPINKKFKLNFDG